MELNKLYKKADNYLNNLSIGLGRGLGAQVKGITGMIDHPINTLQGLYGIASNPQQIPGMVRNALSDASQRGSSGPMGFGEVIGENVGFGRRAPSKLDIIDPDTARALPYSGALPDSPEFAQAVANTPGAQITPDGLMMRIARRQSPDVEGEQAIRTGVFYLPEGDPRMKHYGGKGGYGGTEKYSGDTLLKNPLFVKGATGGKAPEAAYDQVVGKGAYQAMRDEVTRQGPAYHLSHDLKVERVAEILSKYGGDPNMADVIVRSSKHSNTLPYAVQEHIVAHAVRNAGYDAVLGYSKGKTGPFFSEVFDVREQSYPSNVINPQIHEAFDP